MSELDHQIRTLVDGDVRPITFEEIADARNRAQGRWRQPLIAASCGIAVLVVAVGAVVMSGAGSDGSSVQVGSAPPSSTDAEEGSQVLTQPSESMSPTLRAGDQFRVNALAYSRRVPMRGDVVAMNVPPVSLITDMKVLVKRIVGLPGETIEGRDGHIYIDRVVLDETGYLLPTVQSTTFGPVQIPAGQYFMLGDNRRFSNDSSRFGAVARSELLGTVTTVH